MLARVRAASLNALDWRSMRASPFLVRFIGGLRKPKDPRVGADFSGVVESIGKGVKGLRPGDEVFGLTDGAFGEFVAAKETRIAIKPTKVSFEAAASLPIAGFTALQALRDTAHLQRGQSVLVNGAGGGVGTFAVQIAKWLGAEVTAVSRAANREVLRSIGAEHFMDYTEQDFTRGGRHYDVIIDLHPTHSVSQYRRVLTPNGVCVSVGYGGMLRLIGLVLRGKLVRKARGQRVAFMVAKPNLADLRLLGGLVDSGAVTPVIEHRYPLEGLPEAIGLLESGSARGKILVSVEG